MIFDIPDETDFLDAFGLDPDESNPSDGFWSYRFSDDSEVTLVLSFNQFAGSIQTDILVGNHIVETVCHENSRKLEIIKGERGHILKALCKSQGMSTELSVEFSPSINVQWSSLRTE